MKDAGNCEVHWIIHFQHNKPRVITNFAHLKTPRTGPLPASSPHEIHSKEEAIESLDEIVKACKELRCDCMEKMEHLEEKETEVKMTDIASNFNKLLSLFSGFINIINFLKKRSKEDKPQEEE